MDTPPPMPNVEFDAPIVDVFATVFKMIRVIAIVCALLFVGAGGVLAWNFFYFVQDIVLHPDAVVGKWQTALAPAQQALFAPDVPGVPPAPTLEATADPATVPVPTAPVVAVLPTDPAAAEVPVVPEPAPVDTVPIAFTPSEDDDTKLFLDFANSVLNRFELGHFSWLVGMCFLAVFCWVLGKIPGVMISAGAKVLVELLNFEKPKT